MKITFSPEARPEFADAARWYANEAGPQRAADFRNAVHRTLALLAEHPSMGAPAASNTRRIVVHHYPYSIFYHGECRYIARPRRGASKPPTGLLGWSEVGIRHFHSKVTPGGKLDLSNATS